MSMYQRSAATLVVALAFSAATHLEAAVITDGVTATASSQLTSFNRHAINAVNGSGLTDGMHSNNPHQTMWLTTVPGFGGADTDPWYRVDLGAIYELVSFQVWNYNESGQLGRGVNAVDFLISSDGSSFTPAGTFTFAQGSGQNSYTGQSFPFIQTARYVLLDINSNWGGDGYGLSEIQFTQIPEPAVLGLLGLGMMSLMRRRQN
jgi:hypothetical protein